MSGLPTIRSELIDHSEWLPTPVLATASKETKLSTPSMVVVTLPVWVSAYSAMNWFSNSIAETPNDDIIPEHVEAEIGLQLATGLGIGIAIQTGNELR